MCLRFILRFTRHKQIEEAVVVGIKENGIQAGKTFDALESTFRAGVPFKRPIAPVT